MQEDGVIGGLRGPDDFHGDPKGSVLGDAAGAQHPQAHVCPGLGRYGQAP
jgi:hypothetical protein